ncbi:MATE family efflux transporter [Fusobacterium sp.]|uniref:MATE family efflux transporter n=1 Tax=Fusobacterium sp. TaxID=68766 RepID=UPI00396CBE35
MKDKHQLMGTEKIGKLLLQFSLPAIIGMVVNALYNIVDRIYIGNIANVGHLAIAGVGIVFPVIIFVFGFSILIGLGSATNISLNLGRKNQDEAEKYLGTALVYGTVVSFILALIAYIWLDYIVGFLGGSEKTFVYAKEYLKVCILGFPAAVVGYVANASIRADGNPKMAMITLLLGAVTNIVLDPIFIFYFGMGVKGAALATIISQYVSGIWAVYYFYSRFSGIKIRREYLVASFEKIKEITMIGSAPFAIQLGSSVVNYTYNSTLKVYGGDTAIGAMAVVQAILVFTLMPVFGINQGLQPVLGYNYGARLFSRVKEALYKAIFGATAICVFYYIIIQFFSKDLIKIFTHEQGLLDIASRGLKVEAFMLPIIGFQIICTVYFQAVGKPKMSLFMSLSRQIIVLIPCILIMSKMFGAVGIWYAAPVSDFIATLVTLILIKRELKTLKNLEEKSTIDKIKN